MTELNVEVATMYYTHQYERVAVLEERRTEFTNIVVGSSAIALALLVGADNGRGAGTAIVALVVGIANLLAIGHTARIGQQVKGHVQRARTVLSMLSPELADINAQIPVDGSGRWHSGKRYQLLLHVVFVFASAASAAMS